MVRGRGLGRGPRQQGRAPGLQPTGIKGSVIRCPGPGAKGLGVEVLGCPLLGVWGLLLGAGLRPRGARCTESPGKSAPLRAVKSTASCNTDEV